MNQGDFMPHGYCYLWNSRMVWFCHFPLTLASDRNYVS
jgi:hypothetical protein